MRVRFTDFEIDTERQELRRAGTIVHVEPQVFDLLVHLIRHRDRFVGKDELIDVIWHGRIVSEATLSSRISAARRALGDTGNDQSFIRTLYKRGFRFVGEVAETAIFPPAEVAIETSPPLQVEAHEIARLVLADEVLSLPDRAAPATPSSRNSSLDSEATPLARSPTSATELQAPALSASTAIVPSVHGADAAPAGQESPSIASRSVRRSRFALAAVGLASLLVAMAWFLSSMSPSPTTSIRAQSAPIRESNSPAERVATLAPSIIVLPFINLSGDARQDYIPDEITDSLISDLGRALPGMSVVSRGTAFTYKGRNADARQIGRELEARYLLTGSVVAEAERVRVNIQLVETAEGNQLWAERFDTERTSILEVQDEIVSRVSRAIGLQVVDIEARRSRRERPASTEVMDLVLRGKAVLNLPSSPATMIEARDLLEQALKVEPANVDALAGVATTLVFEFVNGYYEIEGSERLQRAERLLDQASAIEPRNLLMLRARAALRRAQGKFNDAIAAAQAIILENPGEPWAYKEIGLSTMYLGQPEQALDWFAKADRIGPRDPGRWTWLDGRGHALILLGRNEEAVQALIAALDANPKNISSHAFLAAAYALLGRSDDAHTALAAYFQRQPDVKVSTFRLRSPVPLALTSVTYRQQHERVSRGLRAAGMPE